MTICEKLVAGEASLAVIGLGYVGMPLALAFAHSVKVIGFDVNAAKIEGYRNGHDYTLEVGDEALRNTSALFTSDEKDLRGVSFYIVAVPTPVDDDNMPDLYCIRSACEIIGRNLSPGAIIVVESTVFSGVTEEVCAPILERESGLVCGRDFKVGYSPERINPGDKEHRLENITKIVAGIDEDTTNEMAKVYSLVVGAKIFKAKSIKVAELAKLEENTQRDINIAFMNEMSIIHDRLGIDTIDVIRAMNTKWNALNFYPSLVGGHCISVDPYYLIYKAEKEHFHSEVVKACRRINNDMAIHVADAAIRQMIEADLLIKKSKVYIFGVTYKRNCPDLRNSMIFDIITRLNEYGVNPIAVDPVADADEVTGEYGINLVPPDDVSGADCIIFAVAHDCFKRMRAEEIGKYYAHRSESKNVIIDIINGFRREDVQDRGYLYWCL